MGSFSFFCFQFNFGRVELHSAGDHGRCVLVTGRATRFGAGSDDYGSVALTLWYVQGSSRKQMPCSSPPCFLGATIEAGYDFRRRLTRGDIWVFPRG